MLPSLNKYHRLTCKIIIYSYDYKSDNETIATVVVIKEHHRNNGIINTISRTLNKKYKYNDYYLHNLVNNIIMMRIMITMITVTSMVIMTSKNCTGADDKGRNTQHFHSR